MENASKALLIAAAILIAILMISLGILLINSTNGVSEEAKQTGEYIATQVGEVDMHFGKKTYNISINCIRMQCR